MSSQRYATLLLALLLAAGGSSAARPESEAVDRPVDGYADLVPNAGQPLPGVITGGQPTPEQLDEAARRGFQTVINLRREEEWPEAAAEVGKRGMAYVALPIGGREDLTEANAAALRAALDGAGRPVLVHCASGNRVGALFALDAYFHDGADIDEAMALGREAGLTRLADSVRLVLERAP